MGCGSKERTKGLTKLILRKKPPLFSFAKAVAANAEEVESMGDDLKPGFLGDLLRHIFQAAQIRIDYFFALGANHVRMWKRLVAVIAVASIRKSKLQNLVDFIDDARK
jgi:hypothetical protein